MSNNFPERIKLPRMILVSGTGRNVGKTGFCCKIINHLSKSHKLSAIKISNRVLDGNPFHGHHTHTASISKETDARGNKDSMRFLKAGADDSWFLQTSDQDLLSVFQQLLPEIEADQLIVCESNALIQWVQPGLFIGIAESNSTKSLYQKPDIIFKALDFESFDSFAERLEFKKDRFTW